MNKQFERYLQMTLIVLDLIVLNLVYLLFHFILSKHIDSNTRNAYTIYWTISIALWLLLSFFLRTYADKIILNFEHFTKRTIQVYLVWIIFLMFYLFFFRELKISRLFIVSTISGFGLGLLINRFIYLGINKYLSTSDYLIKKVIILGYNDTAKKLAKYFEEGGLNTQLIGYIENEENIQELSNYPILAGISLSLIHI